MYSAIITCMFMQIFTLSTGASTRKTDYCKLCAVPGTHTMCLYPTNKLGPDCVSHSRMKLTKKEKRDVVELHNVFRSLVATGEKGALPSAADMFEMVWDDELEIIAQTWANQCKLDHDKCRDSERFPVGQNFATMVLPEITPADMYLALIVAKWSAEGLNFEPSSIDKYKGAEGCGNFTQLIWSRSKRIGCGRVTYKEGNNKGETMFCNYGPAGNIIGEYIYKQGAPCSACPPGSHRSNKYVGLCSGTTPQLQFLQLGITVQTFVMITLCIMM